MLRELPLSLYIHFPWCVRKCPYCDFNSHTLRTELPEKTYINALLEDLEQHLSKILYRPIISIFMGGGTPSLFSPSAIKCLLDELKKRLNFSDDIEITLEVNPGTVEYQRFQAYRIAGVNRLSIGVQSFQDHQLKVLGRIHGSEEASNAVVAAKAAGFENINIDLMHGLPGQSLQEGLEDLNKTFKLTPSHISWYQLTIEPNTEFAVKPPKLPLDDKIWQLQERGKQLLLINAYRQYEISAYSKEAFICVHNRNYWEFGDYLGIGAGAHSKLTDEKEQTVIRTWKHKNPKDYLEKKDNFIGGKKSISDKELAFEFMLNAFRLYYPIPIELFEQRTGLSIAMVKKPFIEAEKLGLFVVRKNSMYLTNRGKRFYNDLVALFLS
ncbi:MAG: radical SAM family heme chaperone HemW [Rickettsiella sp.]|nr:radical SAM family heme chaperone HemW [Rickettsiella sp.]